MKHSISHAISHATPHAYIMEKQAHFERVLRNKLDSLLEGPADYASELVAAIKYSCLNGGKRIRPLLVYATADMLMQQEASHTRQKTTRKTIVEALDAAAIGLEMLHTYSLIHDDLPAMDDDALRRGKPSCHVAFGEAIAILAGDALQALSFTLINQAALACTEHPKHLCSIMQSFSQAAIAMIYGQSIDISLSSRTRLKNSASATIAEAQIRQMHQLKTGALIGLSIQLGTLLCLQSYHDTMQLLPTLIRFGDLIGLAFQIQDDILDVTGAMHHLGKQAGGDDLRGKCTYPKVIGMDASRQRAAELITEALHLLQPWQSHATPLIQVVRYITRHPYVKDQ